MDFALVNKKVYRMVHIGFVELCKAFGGGCLWRFREVKKSVPYGTPVSIVP